MYTAQPSALRRALSLLATFRVWSFSLRSLYVAFTAPESVPPWPGSRTTFPEQGCSCAPAPAAKAAVVRRIAARIAVSTVAHALKRSEYVISPSFPIWFISRRRGGTRKRGSSLRLGLRRVGPGLLSGPASPP